MCASKLWSRSIEQHNPKHQNSRLPPFEMVDSHDWLADKSEQKRDLLIYNRFNFEIFHTLEIVVLL